eukprot:12183-Prorocentrum_minimum.AAC.1
MAHCLRFLTYIGTSLPGPAEHCKPSYANYKTPDTDLATILFRKSGPEDLNCGDLIFSGHVFQVPRPLPFCPLSTPPQPSAAPLSSCGTWISPRNQYVAQHRISTELAPGNPGCSQ